MQFLAIYLYATAVGFVAAGVLASFVQLVSGQPMRFGIEPDSILASLGGVVLRVPAGPAILMRNAWWGRGWWGMITGSQRDPSSRDWGVEKLLLVAVRG